MAFTSEDLAAIERAIASGEMTVRTGDRLVTYRTFDELRAAREMVIAALAAQSASQRPYPRHQLADFTD